MNYSWQDNCLVINSDDNVKIIAFMKIEEEYIKFDEVMQLKIYTKKISCDKAVAVAGEYDVKKSILVEKWDTVKQSITHEQLPPIELVVKDMEGELLNLSGTVLLQMNTTKNHRTFVARQLVVADRFINILNNQEENK